MRGLLLLESYAVFTSAFANEGMWTFENFPSSAVTQPPLSKIVGATPFKIPDSWIRSKAQLDMDTPFLHLHQQRHRRRILRKSPHRCRGKNCRPDV